MDIRAVAIVALFACTGLQAAWRVDLAEWGYKPPPPRAVREAGAVRFLDFDSHNQVLAGFVVRAEDPLATSTDPGLILHVVAFDPDGKFLSDRQFPATSRYQNQIFATSSGNLLLATDQVLRLISPDGKVLAQRDLPRDWWRLWAAPDRTRFWFKNLVVLDAKDLTTVAECSYPDHRVDSISAHNTFLALYKSNSFSHPTEVRAFCGSTQFTYVASQGEPSDGTLLDDDRVVLAYGDPMVELIDRGVRLWRDSLDKRHERIGDHISVDTHGDRFAVLVDTYQGGIRFLDISSTLKSKRVIVYNAKDGKHLVEVPIPKLPKFFLDFALSPDGKLLAIKCDGELQVVAVDRPQPE